MNGNCLLRRLNSDVVINALEYSGAKDGSNTISVLFAKLYSVIMSVVTAANASPSTTGCLDFWNSSKRLHSKERALWIKGSRLYTDCLEKNAFSGARRARWCSCDTVDIMLVSLPNMAADHGCFSTLLPTPP